MKIIFTLILLFMSPAITHASSASDMISACNNIFDGYEGELIDAEGAAKCSGFIQGYQAAITQAANLYPNQKQVVCLPKGISIEQLARVIVNSLKEQPELLHIDGATMAVDAIRTVFPCKKILKTK